MTRQKRRLTQAEGEKEEKMRLLYLMTLLSAAMAFKCYTGTPKNKLEADCTVNHRYQHLNYSAADATTYVQAKRGCCLRTVSGPSVSLSCGTYESHCEKAACYDTETINDYERNFVCVCTGDNCNGAAGFSLAVAAFTPLLALLIPH